MNDRIKLGRRGEDLAASWLQTNGYHILYRNYRFGRYEIDIVAKRENAIHVFEIKTRRSDRYGFPESGISSSKLNNIRAASTSLIDQLICSSVQINILSILISANAIEYFLIEDIN